MCILVVYSAIILGYKESFKVDFEIVKKLCFTIFFKCLNVQVLQKEHQDLCISTKCTI